MNVRLSVSLISFFSIFNHSMNGMLNFAGSLNMNGSLNMQGTLNFNGTQTQIQNLHLGSAEKPSAQSQDIKSLDDALKPTPKTAQENSNKAKEIITTYCKENDKKTAELMALAQSAFNSDSSQYPKIQQRINEISHELNEVSKKAETSIKSLK